MRDQRKVIDDLITKTLGQQTANIKWQSSLAEEWRSHSRRLEDEKQEISEALRREKILHKATREELRNVKILYQESLEHQEDLVSQIYQSNLEENTSPREALED